MAAMGAARGLRGAGGLWQPLRAAPGLAGKAQAPGQPRWPRPWAGTEAGGPGVASSWRLGACAEGRAGAASPEMAGSAGGIVRGKAGWGQPAAPCPAELPSPAAAPGPAYVVVLERSPGCSGISSALMGG